MLYMNKRLHFLLALLTVALAIKAGPISKSAALSKARAIAAGQGKTISASAEPAYKAPRKGAAQGEASYYVFNFDGDGGFIIMAGDDAVAGSDGVLGMTGNGRFDAGRLPENFKAWLDACAGEVEAVAGGAVAYAPEVHAAIEPMISSQWNQSEPYNNLMPTYTYLGTTHHYYTGCTITAMTQVMRYHKWPQGMTSTIPASGGQSALEPTTFDWDNMKDIYGGSDTEAEETAVAHLMRYCAQAAKAEYDYNGTGATIYNAAEALKNYFGYSQATHNVLRSMYTISEWDALIYGELAAGRPVVYSGSSSSVGHAFVCDGYRDALYHINWGWGGYCDGYFRLAVLNPSGSGIGGSTTEDGYSMTQEVIIGMQPPAAGDTPASRMLTSYSVEASASYVAFDYFNMTSEAGVFDFGCELADAAGNKQTLWSFSNNTFNSYTGTYTIGDYLSRYSIAAGTYKLYPVCRESGNSQWVRCSSPSLYADVTVGTDRTISVTTHPQAGMTATDITLPGNCIATATQEVQVTVSNSGDEVYGTVYLGVQTPDGTEYEIKNYTGIAVEHGGEETVSLFFKPETAGSYSLRLIGDDGVNRMVIGQKQVSIAAAPTAKSNLWLRSAVTLVGDTPNTIKTSLTNNGTDTYLRPVVARLYKDMNDGTGYFSWVEDVSVYQPIEPSEWQEFLFTFTNLIGGERYAVEIRSYNYFSDESPDNIITEKVFTATTGITTVTGGTSDNDDDSYYTLAGHRIMKPTAKGIYIHRGRKVVIK